MSKVLLISTQKQPLDPIHPAVARQLLKNKKAAVFRRYPFTLILKESIPQLEATVHPLRLKIDPGANITGFAVVNDVTGEIPFAAELTHRGFAIRDSLKSRRSLRRGRRNRHTRYRQPRFNNRKRFEGWLAPSLQSRIENIMTWVNRLSKFMHITDISQELVKFDMQLMQDETISGIEYQQGTLAGYELREYLLERDNRCCAYCDKNDKPLQIEHIVPRSKGGSNRVSNLTLSCEKCNLKKGTQSIEEFLKKDPERLKKIKAHVKKPLAAAATVNATRFALLERLHTTGLPVETGSGGLTKFNRSQQRIDKTHWTDAAAVGESTPKLLIKGVKPLLLIATGHGSRQSCRTDKHGFPNRYVPRKKVHFGFQTGEIIKATVTKGKKKGIHVGRVAVRSDGNFNISTSIGLVQGINHRYCKLIHAKDGYGYT